MKDSKKDIKSAFGAPFIEEKEITLGPRIGGGAFGDVYKSQVRGTACAVKVPKTQDFSTEQLADFRAEINIMSQLYHPNICLFMGASLSSKKIFIVNELLDGDLEKLLADRKTMTLYKRMQLAKQAAQGLAWLHGTDGKGIIHRDIKLANLLYKEVRGRGTDRSFLVKVCDFGLSQTIKKKIQDADEESTRGSLLWMAPEVMKVVPFDSRADVYSFGLVLWEIATQKVLFPHHFDPVEFKEAITLKKERPPLPSSSECPPALIKLMTDCWQDDPKKRPFMKEVVTRFNEVIVESCITDERGRTFWKKFFLGREEVPWKEFSTAFYKFIGKEKPTKDGKDETEYHKLNCLRSFISNLEGGFDSVDADKIDETLVVPLSVFGQLLGFLGPWTDTLLTTLADLVHAKWFWGKCASDKAVGALENLTNDAFLIRYSNNEKTPWNFALSYRRDRTRQVHIKHKPGGKKYTIIHKGKRHTAASLIKLVPKVAKLYSLQYPCPGSPLTPTTGGAYEPDLSEDDEEDEEFEFESDLSEEEEDEE